MSLLDLPVGANRVAGLDFLFRKSAIPDIYCPDITLKRKHTIHSIGSDQQRIYSPGICTTQITAIQRIAIYIQGYSRAVPDNNQVHPIQIVSIAVCHLDTIQKSPAIPEIELKLFVGLINLPV